MSLLVTIIKSPESVTLAETSKTFDAQGGSIGRGQSNSWVLDDPERFLSSCHCQLSNEAGQFFITDMSTNGTFYNGSANPIGKGVKQPLNNGDQFSLGDYEFSVSISGGASLSDPFASDGSSAPSSISDDIFSTPDAGFGSNAGDSPFATGHVSSSESLFGSDAEETDPLAALDKAQGGSMGNNMGGSTSGATGSDIVSGNSGFGGDPFSSPTPATDPMANFGGDPFSGGTHSDQADPLQQQVTWPDAVPEAPQGGGGIPDDWDDDLMSSPAPAAAPPVTPPAAPAPVPPPVAPSTPLTEPSFTAPPEAAPTSGTGGMQDKLQITTQFNAQESEILSLQNQEYKKANAKLQTEIEILRQRINTMQQGTKTDVTVDTTLLDAMGFQSKNLVDAEINQLNQLAGEVLREMVSGLMQVLGSRSSIKNEFRMNVTTIQPVENNPLKFSANVDDALENMFIKQGNAYKKPLEAVREGFEGIAEHQVAILAGIRSAFKGVVERFDPVLLEARFSKQNKGGLIPGSHKAKNWDLYLDYYNELVGDIDNTFQYLFGDDFVQAYEDQLQKLAIARKSNKKPSQ